MTALQPPRADAPLAPIARDREGFAGVVARDGDQRVALDRQRQALQGRRRSLASLAGQMQRCSDVRIVQTNTQAAPFGDLRRAGRRDEAQQQAHAGIGGGEQARARGFVERAPGTLVDDGDVGRGQRRGGQADVAALLRDAAAQADARIDRVAGVERPALQVFVIRVGPAGQQQQA